MCAVIHELARTSQVSRVHVPDVGIWVISNALMSNWLARPKTADAVSSIFSTIKNCKRKHPPLFV